MRDRNPGADDQAAQTCFEVDRAKVAEPDQATADNKVPPQVLAMMAVTTLVTFGTLSSGYSLLF
jgi:hypothetical protein